MSNWISVLKHTPHHTDQVEILIYSTQPHGLYRIISKTGYYESKAKKWYTDQGTPIPHTVTHWKTINKPSLRKIIAVGEEVKRKQALRDIIEGDGNPLQINSVIDRWFQAFPRQE